ncbi:DUF1501 domain-containing protein [Gemmata sp.]|uniref:DUF1501 domain-containing protein n=1 Tax=Gemmata sp. TaxID=1914242 RepID=UPI003F71AF11
MLTLRSGPASRTCSGVTRRAAIKAGFLGVGGLGLPDYLRAKAAHPAARGSGQKSVILIWLDGGPSQLETFDPKPDAPAEFRGPFGVHKTRTPGVVVSELMPHLATRFDKFSVVRSLHHDNGDHFAAAHWMTTGRFGATSINQAQKYPSVGSIVAKVKGTYTPGLPAYVGLPAAETVYLYPGYMGAAYLGGAYNPFDADRDHKYIGAFGAHRVRSPKWLSNLASTKEAAENTAGKTSLLRQFDTVRRDIDQSGVMSTMDKYQQQALDLVLGSEARVAFDIDREDPKAIDRYGPSPWGQYAAMARRLVEAGVPFVTVDMPHWDDHSSLVKSHAPKIRTVDRIVAALLDDLDDRGLLESTLVVVMGEFGRTPRINTGQPGIPVPGRDHWGNAISVLVAGGGIRPGVVVGRTNARAEHPVERALKPEALLATIYHQLGIDANETFKDHTGRPVPITDDPTPIRELI